MDVNRHFQASWASHCMGCLFRTVISIWLRINCVVPQTRLCWLDSEMTYYVSSGTLNPTHSLTHLCWPYWTSWSRCYETRPYVSGCLLWSKPIIVCWNAGPFMSALLNKLELMVQNPLYVNLQLTGLLSRLACYPQPLLKSLLLSNSLVFQPSVKSLLQVSTTLLLLWLCSPSMLAKQCVVLVLSVRMSVCVLGLRSIIHSRENRRQIQILRVIEQHSTCAITHTQYI